MIAIARGSCFGIIASLSMGASSLLAQSGGYTNWNSLTNWTESSAPSVYWRAIACSADASRWVAVENGAIYASTNAGSTWTQTTAPAKAWVNIASSADGTKLVAIESGGTIYRSTNAGATWIQANAPANGWQGVACSSDGVKLVACDNTDGGIYLSTDSGATWNLSGAPTNTPFSYMPWASVSSSADGTVLAATCEIGIFTSTNAGATWTQTSAPSVTGFDSLGSSADGTKLAAVSYYGIYTSTNSGVSWTKTSALDASWWHITSSADGSILAAVEDSIELLSTNGGVNWSQTQTPFENSQACAISADGTALGVADGYGGIWFARASTTPSIVPPASVTVSTGARASLSAGVSGTPPLVYRWTFNGAAVAGATNSALTLTNVNSASVGRYTIVVTNAYGRVTSRPATLATVDSKIFGVLPGVVINGPLGSNYLIQASSDLSGVWTPLTNVALPAQPYTFIDQRLPTSPQQFYRATPQ
jgi:hypothetical protein